MRANRILLVTVVVAVLLAPVGSVVAFQSPSTATPAVDGPGVALSQEEIPEELDIGSVEVGNSTTKSFTVTNPSNFTLEVSDSSISGEDADAFSIVSGGGSVTIDPGESHTFTIEFAPTHTGDHDAELAVTTNAPTSPHTTALDGNGETKPEPDISVTPAEADFGNVNLDTEASTSFVIENTGDATLNVSDVSLSGGSGFSLDSGSVASLDPGETSTVTVTFAPSTAGEQTGTLSVTSNDPDDGTVSVSFVGEGVETSLRVSSGSLDFGEQAVVSSTTKTVEVTNDGDTAVSLTDVSLDDGDTDAFEITTDDLSGTLEPGESVSIEIEFAPTKTGGFGALLSIGTNSSEIPPTSVSLSGTGAAADITVAPNTVNYGSVELDAVKTRTVTVLNRGTLPLNVEKTMIVGSDSSHFSVVSGGGSFTLEPGERHTVTVAFEPRSSGTKSAQLRFISDDPNNPQTDVWLSNTRTVVSVNQESDVEEEETTSDLTVQDAQPGSTVEVNVSQGPENDSVETFGLEIGDESDARIFCSGGCGRASESPAGDDFDFTLSLTTSTDQLDTAPMFELAKRNGTVPLSYLRVTHTIADSDIDEVTFTKRVSKQQLDELNASIDDYAMYRYVDGEWVELDTEVVEKTSGYYVIEVTSPGLSDFTSGVKQPKFDLINTQLSTSKITSGDTTQVRVKIRNNGGADGTYTARLLLNGETVERKDVTIASDGIRTIVFEEQITKPGTYTVTVNEIEAGSLEVEASDPGITATATASGDDSSSSNGNSANDGNNNDDSSTSTSTPGFTSAVTLLALLVMLVVAIRRTH